MKIIHLSMLQFNNDCLYGIDKGKGGLLKSSTIDFRSFNDILQFYQVGSDGVHILLRLDDQMAPLQQI